MSESIYAMSHVCIEGLKRYIYCMHTLDDNTTIVDQLFGITTTNPHNVRCDHRGAHMHVDFQIIVASEITLDHFFS